MTQSTPNSSPPASQQDRSGVATITPEETASLAYAKNVKEFYQGIFVYLVLAVVLFAKFGFDEPVMYWVFGGAGIGIAFQGLLAFEKIRLPSFDWERRIAEKKLGRRL